MNKVLLEKVVAELTALHGDLAGINKRMTELVDSLGAPHTKRLPMGIRYSSLLQDVAEMTARYPDTVPAGISAETMPLYLSAGLGFVPLLAALHQLEKTAKRFKLHVDSFALRDAGTYYKYVELLTKRQVPGVNSIFLKLREHFKHKGQRKQENNGAALPGEVELPGKTGVLNAA
jgi:hypothetical protein